MKEGVFQSTRLRLVGTLHLLPHENILTIALINKLYFYIIYFDSSFSSYVRKKTKFHFFMFIIIHQWSFCGGLVQNGLQVEHVSSVLLGYDQIWTTTVNINAVVSLTDFDSNLIIFTRTFWLTTLIILLFKVLMQRIFRPTFF